MTSATDTPTTPRRPILTLKRKAPAIERLTKRKARADAKAEPIGQSAHHHLKD